MALHPDFSLRSDFPVLQQCNLSKLENSKHCLRSGTSVHSEVAECLGFFPVFCRVFCIFFFLSHTLSKHQGFGFNSNSSLLPMLIFGFIALFPHCYILVCTCPWGHYWNAWKCDAFQVKFIAYRLIYSSVKPICLKVSPYSLQYNKFLCLCLYLMTSLLLPNFNLWCFFLYYFL